MKTWLSILTAIVIAATAVASAGCGMLEDRPPPDEIAVQLKWIHQAQFAGIYAADQKGFYTEENIDITIQAGGGDMPPSQIIDDLVAGESSFAIVGGDELLSARSQGKPVVAIAVIFQKNPYVYVTLKDSGIQHPQDFTGKRLMVPTNGETQHLALLNKLGLDPAAIEYMPYTRDTTPLTSGQIDVHMASQTLQPLPRLHRQRNPGAVPLRSSLTSHFIYVFILRSQVNIGR